MEEAAKQDFLKAGKIVAQGLALGKKRIKPGANIKAVCEEIEKHILDSGAGIAFPAQVSIDEVAAHWCPEPKGERAFEEGQLVKLDIGAQINGRIADAAISIDLSTDQKHAKLIQAAEDARDAALAKAKPGVTLGEIGRAIQDTITKAGFSPVKNLGGHGLGKYDVHVAPSIPNIDTKDDTPLEEGMVIAIEPFASTGIGQVHEQEYGNIYQLTGKARVRGRYAREAQKLLKQLHGLPFSLHWLASRMGEGQARFAIKELYGTGLLEVYPPLAEEKGVFIAQAEHSVIVGAEPVIYTKT